MLGRQAAASSLGQAIGSVVAGLGFGLMNREPFWAAAATLLLIGTAPSAELRCSQRRPRPRAGPVSERRPR